MISARNGVWRPTICESSMVFRPAKVAPVRIGMPKPPKATGTVLARSARAAADRLEAQTRHERAGDRHRSPAAVASRSLEDESCEDDLYPAVVTDARQRVPLSCQWPVSTITL